MMVAQYTYYQWRPLGFRQAQNYMVYSLRDLIISCVAIDWNLELKSNFCIPLTFAMDNDDDNDDDAHNAVATVLGSQFGREREREWPEDPASDPCGLGGELLASGELF